jgi:hypothetical protein
MARTACPRQRGSTYKEYAPHINALKGIINMISEGGSLVLGACFAANDKGEFLKTLWGFSKTGNINIYGSIDEVPIRPDMLDVPLASGISKSTNKPMFNHGWGVVGPDGQFKTLQTENYTGQIILRTVGKPIDLVTKN